MRQLVISYIQGYNYVKNYNSLVERYEEENNKLQELITEREN